MHIISNLFIIIPLLATVCNLFLLLTFLSARKNRLIASFMLLLTAFTLWPLASLFMRLNLVPGDLFWFQVSMSAIICVPLFIYMFLYNYTSSRGFFLMLLFTLGTIIMVFLNARGLFITNPLVTVDESGNRLFVYEISWASIFLVLFAAWELFTALRLIHRSIATGGLPIQNFLPFFIGIAILAVAMVLDLVPDLAFVFPVDPFACMINAFLIYYMLYKKRLFTLTQFASSGSTYLVSAVLTTVILLSSFPALNSFMDQYLTALQEYKTLIMAVVFSVATILVFTLLKKLANNLFVKGQQAREDILKNFSFSINKTLDRRAIIDLFAQVIRENVDTEAAQIFVRSPDGSYPMAACTDKMRSTSLTIQGSSPLVKWLQTHRESVTYSAFRHTPHYKSLWETEKQTFLQLQTELIVPIVCEETLMGIVLLSPKGSKKAYAFTEISFLESVASVVSIAMKNADLYETIREEARLDPLTNIYNRRCFTEQFEAAMEEHHRDCVTLMLINFDDFRLYNELYGSADGDEILICFARILRQVVGSRGFMGRYGGKEFSICLPLCSGEEAQACAETLRQELNRVLQDTSESTKKFLTFSAGICTYPSAASNGKQMFTYANMAVDHAKKSGKNKTIVYTHHQMDAPGDSLQDVEAIGQEYAPTIYALTAAIDAKDHYTFNHSENVSYLSTQLARAIGLDPEHVEMIRQAGLLHDIGKISIPEAILTKTSRLTPEEYEVMQNHVTNSISMIRHLPSLDYVIPIAISHHERYDGTGYPRRLAGESIPEGGRILCIADAFDAMASRRPYKAAMPIQEALGEIEKGLGKQFDPHMGRIFVDLVRNGAIKTDCYQ